jgi:acyl carrier protein
MQDIFNQICAIMRDVFEDEALMPTLETTAKQVEGWDSISHIHFMLAVESAFNIRFSSAEMAALRNIGHLVEVIARKKVP